ncbi:unnamed protein product [Rotaria sp. Silwood1]|nr:unnamed protein product [Rotaria sp. Silwood1]CAF1557719.1 unnamed protein product [Rotaria sp. Silwood1]
MSTSLSKTSIKRKPLLIVFYFRKGEIPVSPRVTRQPKQKKNIVNNKTDDLPVDSSSHLDAVSFDRSISNDIIENTNMLNTSENVLSPEGNESSSDVAHNDVFVHIDDVVHDDVIAHVNDVAYINDVAHNDVIAHIDDIAHDDVILGLNDVAHDDINARINDIVHATTVDHYMHDNDLPEHIRALQEERQISLYHFNQKIKAARKRKRRLQKEIKQLIEDKEEQDLKLWNEINEEYRKWRNTKPMRKKKKIKRIDVIFGGFEIEVLLLVFIVPVSFCCTV